MCFTYKIYPLFFFPLPFLGHYITNETLLYNLLEKCVMGTNFFSSNLDCLQKMELVVHIMAPIMACEDEKTRVEISMFKAW